MEKAFFDFMSAIDIDSYRNIRECDFGKELSYADILQIIIIAHKENMTVSELSEKLNLSRPATTQKVNELVERGFVTKTQCKSDKRVSYLNVSKELIENAQNAKAATLVEEVNKHFSEEKKEVFKEILNFMTKKLLEE